MIGRARALIVIDEERMRGVIAERRPASVALNGPDGMIPRVQEAASRLSAEFGIPAYVIADTTWGSCDLNTAGARTLGAEILFNIGHTVSIGEFDGGRVVMVDAYDDVGFEEVARKCIPLVSGRRVSLMTDSQHLRELGRVRTILEDAGVDVRVGEGGGQLSEGQVFGCEFYPAADSDAELNVFLGQSSFHAAGVALATGRQTYALDPYFAEVRDVTEFAQKMQRRATGAIYSAAQAESFGVIVGLRDGQLSKAAALRIKRGLERAGRRVQLFAMTDITADRLECISGVDAFVQSACPRISTDNRFPRPVLSLPQADALLRVLEGGEPGEYLRARHWL